VVEELKQNFKNALNDKHYIRNLKILKSLATSKMSSFGCQKQAAILLTFLVNSISSKTISDTRSASGGARVKTSLWGKWLLL
jgi:hypothetical protein